MKLWWIAGLAVVGTTTALAQTTIYKHVDESGRVTYSNKPMKGATVMELEPITIMTSTPAPAPAPRAVARLERVDTPKQEAAQPKQEQAAPTNVASISPMASVEPQLQRKRDNDRRRILEDELAREEQTLSEVRNLVTQEQQNPALIAAVRMAQSAADPSPSQMAEMRTNIDKASGRIRGLQATVAEHEKNIEALKKELGALKP